MTVSPSTIHCVYRPHWEPFIHIWLEFVDGKKTRGIEYFGGKHLVTRDRDWLAGHTAPLGKRRNPDIPNGDEITPQDFEQKWREAESGGAFTVLLAWRRFVGRTHRKFACPCCGYLTLSRRDHYEICPVC